MPSVCVAFGCSSNSEINPGLIFHMFPNPSKDEERRQKWVHALKRKNFTPGRTAKLCCLHFEETDYDPPVKITAPKRLKKDAVPSVFDYQKYLLPMKVPKIKPLLPVIPNKVPEENVHSIPLMEEPSFKNVAVQTTLTGIELTETITHLRLEKKMLQQKVARLNRRVESFTCRKSISREIVTCFSDMEDVTQNS